MAKRWEAEDELVSDIKAPPRSKTKEDGAYEPFQDDGGPVEVTKGPGKKPAPTTVTTWSPKMSAPPGNVPTKDTEE